jgi:carbamoyltransferase
MIATLNSVDWSEGLFYTSDGGGDYEFYSATLLHEGSLTPVWPKVDVRTHNGNKDSLGILYANVTEALGFLRNRHEGKVLGLAAFGEPTKAEYLKSFYSIDELGRIRGSLIPKTELRPLVDQLVSSMPRENVAATVQSVLEELTLESLSKILAKSKVKKLGVSGGVFANVKLTQRIQERFQLDEVFVYPAMSDQGISAGGVLQYLLDRDGLERWLENRRPLQNVYFGRDYTSRVNDTLLQGGMTLDSDGFVAKSVELLKQGKTIGTYIGRMEYGPRALGNRTILAQATDRSINDWLNKKLQRTEFMPFAPVVRMERADDVFEMPSALTYSCQYMTATVDVRPQWKDQIPAVVHVDGTARPQLIVREQNPLYYDVLHEYEKATGIPALINTSFNVHEEPIINAPEEALRALAEKRVDHLLTEAGIWSA